MQSFSSISNNHTNQKSLRSTHRQKKQELFFKPVIQPKLTINQPNDIYEQEADTMADKIMRMTDNETVQTKFFKPAISPVQRKCENCEEEEQELQRKEMNEKETTADNDLEKYVGHLDGSGEPLPNEVRNYYESRFGYDFSNVKVHTDTVAAKSAQSIKALAYTSGNNIVFNNRQYSPDSDSGKRLLGHELTHVVQQSNAKSPSTFIQMARWGTCPTVNRSGEPLTRQDGRNPFIYGAAELYAVARYKLQYPTHCVLTNEELVAGIIPTCSGRENTMLQQIFRHFHRDRSPVRRRGTRPTGDVTERAESTGVHVEALLEAVQSLLQPDILDLTSLEIYDITTDRQAVAKRAKIRNIYVPRLRALTHRSWDPGRALPAFTPISFPILTSSEICFAPTDFAVYPGVIQYTPLGNRRRRRRRRDRRRRQREQTRRQRQRDQQRRRQAGERRRQTDQRRRQRQRQRRRERQRQHQRQTRGRSGGGYNYGFGISFGSASTGAGNAGVGVSIMSNGASAGTVSGGLIYNSEGIAIGSASVGASIESQGAAAGAAAVGASVRTTAAGAGVAGAGSITESTVAAAGAAGSGSMSGVTGATAGTVVSQQEHEGATEDTRQQVPSSSSSAEGHSGADPQGDSETPVESEQSSDAQQEQSHQESEGATADSTTTPTLSISGRTPQEASQMIQEAARIERTLQTATPAQLSLLRHLAEQHPEGVYTVPAAQWINTILSATQGVSEEDVLFLETLEWESGLTTIEELRNNIQRVLQTRTQGHTPPIDHTVEAAEERETSQPQALERRVVQEEARPTQDRQGSGSVDEGISQDQYLLEMLTAINNFSGWDQIPIGSIRSIPSGELGFDAAPGTVVSVTLYMRIQEVRVAARADVRVISTNRSAHPATVRYTFVSCSRFVAENGRHVPCPLNQTTVQTGTIVQ